MKQEWRCRECERLLGVWRNGRLHLQHKKAQYLVDGRVLAVCPNCSALNEADSKQPSEAVLRG